MLRSRRKHNSIQTTGYTQYPVSLGNYHIRAPSHHINHSECCDSPLLLGPALRTHVQPDWEAETSVLAEVSV